MKTLDIFFLKYTLTTFSNHLILPKKILRISGFHRAIISEKETSI